MMLIAIGESLKKFERSGGKALMDQHTEIDWKGAKVSARMSMPLNRAEFDLAFNLRDKRINLIQ
jgi:hypothetical protein